MQNRSHQGGGMCLGANGSLKISSSGIFVCDPRGLFVLGTSAVWCVLTESFAHLLLMGGLRMSNARWNGLRDCGKSRDGPVPCGVAPALPIGRPRVVVVIQAYVGLPIKDVPSVQPEASSPPTSCSRHLLLHKTSWALKPCCWSIRSALCSSSPW